jgi:tetratricopeptide (TPR) repeat protein
LRHADFTIELQNLQKRWVPGTCKWFLEHKKYATWRQSEPTSSGSFKLLWVHGKPGSGKSTLAAQVVLDLRRLPGSTVLFVSCKGGQENMGSLQSILQNLIFQLLENKTHSKRFHQIIQSARLNAKTQYVQSIGELWNLLQRMLPVINMAYLVLDGLDECNSEIDELSSFLSRLTELFSGVRGGNVKVMVISRLDKLVLEDVLYDWQCIDIQTSDVRGDIEEVFRYNVQRSQVLRHHKDLPSIQEKLINDSEGMFLWIDLMIKELEAGHWDIGSVLQKAPGGLSGIFEAILKRIVLKATSVVSICNALAFVLTAGRPLRIEELAIGVALLGGLRSHEDYDARGDARLAGQMIIREITPLVMVMPDNTVQLVHKSFKDFLLGEEIRNAASRITGLSRFCFQSRELQKKVVLASVRYLSFECFKSELPGKGLVQLHSKFLLLDYSSHWLVHHAVESEDQAEVADRLVTFFHSPQGWRWLRRLHEQYGMSYGHLQLLQSRMKTWALLAVTNNGQQEILCGFLTFLNKRRLKDTISAGADGISILQVMGSLTTVYENLGQWTEAESIALEAVETSRRMIGEEDPLALTSMANLASIYVNQSRLADAERLHVQTADIRKRVLGEEHPDTLVSMSSLASTFWSQGRWDEAETLHMSVLETRKRILGEEHSHTLLSMANLATTYLSQGRWGDAEQLGLQVMEARKRLLGEEHPHTLASTANLASAYWHQGRWSDAEMLGTELVGKCQTIFGAEHPHTLLSMSNLATAIKEQGRLNEAESLEIQVLEARKKALGADHPHTLTSMGNLASTYWSHGRCEEAERLDLQVIEGKLAVLGPKHPDTLVSMSNLAHSYRSIGRSEEALELEAKVSAAEGGT